MSIYIPKGGLCITCKFKLNNCSQLPFSTMKPIKDYRDGYIAVKCEKYEREAA
jgi:hypothetical protein